MLTDDELKRIAIQCGLDYSYTKASLREFANAIRADEREACARVCEERGEAYVSKWANAGDDMETQSKAYAWEAKQHAIAIRARKEKE